MTISITGGQQGTWYRVAEWSTTWLLGAEELACWRSRRREGGNHVCYGLQMILLVNARPIGKE
jgi:hypothetical protein